MRHLRHPLRPRLLCLATLLMAMAMAVMAACGGDEDSLTVYAGRSDNLVGPLVHAFSAETGIAVQVKYASSAATAATILEEGDNTPADVVFLQDPGSLGSLSQAQALATIPQALLDRVDPRFRSSQGDWVGTSGRARTVAYNTSNIDPERDLPDSIVGFVNPVWNGRIGWAPGNGSFQAFLTSFRMERGDGAARRWLEGIKANNPRLYSTNTSIVEATARGEVDVGLVNHYYIERLLEERGQEFGARNHFLRGGDPGALVLVAGVGMLRNSDDAELAQQFIDYLLSESAQQYFASHAKEYPLTAGVAPSGDLPPLDSLDPPDVDLGSLSDLQGTLALLRETGILP